MLHVNVDTISEVFSMLDISIRVYGEVWFLAYVLRIDLCIGKQEGSSIATTEFRCRTSRLEPLTNPKQIGLVAFRGLVMIFGSVDVQVLQHSRSSMSKEPRRR